MYNLPSSTIADLKEGQRQTANIVYWVTPIGDVYEEDVYITESDIVQGGLTVDRQCAFGIGGATAAELSLTLYNGNGKFDSVNFEHGQFTVRVGVRDWDNPDSILQNIPLGIFLTDSMPTYDRNTICIKALDRMILFDKVVNDWSNYTFPMTVADFVAAICELAGVGYTYSQLMLLPNSSYMVYWRGEIDSVTLRTLLRWGAFILGANAYINWSGELSMHGFYSSPYPMALPVGTFDRYRSAVSKDSISVTGIEYTDADGSVTTVGTSGYVLKYSGCAILDHDVSSVLSDILSSISNMTFSTGSLEIFSAPFLWPMDRMIYNPVGSIVPVTGINFTINRHTRIMSEFNNVRAQGSSLPTGSDGMQISLTEADIVYIKQLITNALSNV